MSGNSQIWVIPQGTGGGGGGLSSFNGRTDPAAVLLQSDATAVLNIKRTVVPGTTYTVLATDFGGIVALTNTSARTITLPLANTVTAGLVCKITDEAGTASTNAVWGILQGSDSLQGSVGTFVFTNLDYSSISLYSDGVSKYFAV